MSTKSKQKGDVAVKDRQEVKTPRMYKVLLHNDHYTSMEFVVQVLTSIFGQNARESFRIMMNVHENGTGIAGVYTAEIAEAKITKTTTLAQGEGFPLKCTMEPE